MSDHRLHSFWLSDWRRLLDEADMPPRTRRTVEAAIHKQERVWADRHARKYSERVRRRNDMRNEKVVGAYEAMTRRLKEIRAEIAAGRMDPKQARREMREMRGLDAQAAQIHDTLVEEDAELERFAAMTPDAFQRSELERFPSLKQSQLTLAGVAADIDPPPPPGGGFHTPIPNPLPGGGTDPDVYAREGGMAPSVEWTPPQ